MNLIDLMNWRYATKKMDPSKSVSPEQLDRILEATRLSASSSGLQPYDVLVVTNTALRQQIQAAAHNQAQITEGSHLLVFAAWDNYTRERIMGMFDLMAEKRGGQSDTAIAYRDRLLESSLARDAQKNFEHAARQAYIGLGTAMIACAAEGVDATPMEGFNPSQVDEILGLRDQGLRSVVLLPLGFRESGKDWLETQAKVRRAKEDWALEVK